MTKQAHMQLLLDKLVVRISTQPIDVSPEELQFALLSLLRTCQSMLSEHPNLTYTETKLHAAYNLLTGETVYPF